MSRWDAKSVVGTVGGHAEESQRMVTKGGKRWENLNGNQNRRFPAIPLTKSFMNILAKRYWPESTEEVIFAIIALSNND